MKKVDYLIIGGGLAGTILGDGLCRNNKVFVFDKDAGEYGSKVAAGIFNPVTGRRMVKSWMVDTFAPFALNYYKKNELNFGLKLIDTIDIQRLFHNEEQRKEWLSRVDFDQLQDIILNEIKPDPDNEYWFKEYGGVTTTSSWRLNTAAFLDGIHEKWRQNGILQNRTVTYDEIQVNSEYVQVQDVIAKKLIFCEGWKMGENPWFGYLPISPNKGELLTIEAEGLEVNDLIQKKIFFLPIGDNKYKVGATYDRENHNYTPTESAKNWLIERLENVIKVPFKILDQKAGVRPATIDRRPFVGQHPQQKNLFIFNGFGSKGVHQIPWIAEHFIDFITNGSSLESQLNINRFKSSS